MKLPTPLPPLCLIHHYDVHTTILSLETPGDDRPLDDVTHVDVGQGQTESGVSGLSGVSGVSGLAHIKSDSPQMGQIWDFLRSVSVPPKNELKLIFKKPQICPIWGQFDTIWMQNLTSLDTSQSFPSVG